ncbi:NAD(P)/FAD-dependent oxidoreductase [Yoonia sp. SS1-5]|uniref:NAD(P)/FAD-dependent oxidoreductase n=1 Tax=Yoonia rhodophyticola TaxID=3137370 RepID=A0AAN0NK04_9RHOB
MDATPPLRVGVIGGGIVGICSALALREAGHAVTVIERHQPGQGTSSGNAGVISPWSIAPQAMPGIWRAIPGMVLRPYGAAGVALSHGPRYLKWLVRFLREARPARVAANANAMHVLCDDSPALYRQLLAGTGHENLIADSMYVHAFRDPGSADINALGYRLRIEKGADVEQIGGDALRQLEPALSRAFKSAILIKGQARALDPGKIGAVLADKLVSQGGQIEQGTVSALSQQDHGWSVVTDAQTHIFDKVVLAAGAWSAKLLAPLGIKVPLAAERGYHVAYPDTGLTLNNSIMDVAGHAVASSMNGALRVAGIAEFAGTETPPNPRRIEAVRRTAVAMFPELEGQRFDSWMGVRPSFPDSLPILDEVAGRPGLICAFGHSHYGLMMAPKTGRFVASLASGLPQNINTAAYSASRFL